MSKERLEQEITLRQNEVAEYDLNIRKYTLAIEMAKEEETPDEDFIKRLEDLIKSEHRERKKSHTMQRAATLILDEVAPESRGGK